MKKLPAADFAAFLLERYYAHDGYIMGARGENPQKWRADRWPYTQYKGKQLASARAWRDNAPRVWDCQGMAEGYINQLRGTNIDVRARDNYAAWCDPKGKGSIPMSYRMPGAAVFKAYSSGVIHHVGYLVEPVEPDKPGGDWYVVEAKGVMYGVVKTKLSADKAWNRWGLMTKYFDYSAYANRAYELGERTLRAGCTGDDVRSLQAALIGLDIYCGKWGADGDFGADTRAAVEVFQRKFRLPIDGTFDEDDFDALRAAQMDDDPDEPEPSYRVDALDLSSHNAYKEPQIDWTAIRRDVGFVALRCGCTRVKTKPMGIGADAYFAKWAQACNDNGVPFWAYYYSHAADDKQARAEARYLYEHASPYRPVGYCIDAEECGLTGPVISAAMDELRKRGAARTMLYVAQHRYKKYDLAVDKDGFVACADATWIPGYGKNDGSATAKYLPKWPCDMWQYTSVYQLDAVPDKTIDANLVTGQRKTISWFRGESE